MVEKEPVKREQELLQKENGIVAWKIYEGKFGFDLFPWMNEQQTSSISYALENYGEFIWKSRDAYRYMLTLACADKQSTRTMMTNGREIQKFREGDWTERTTLIRIFPDLH